MRAIIVDDEFLARKRLEKLLEEDDDVKIVGEAKNGNDAYELIKSRKPDLVFLDIQMPQMDGLSLLDKLENPPLIIFTTAYDKYALKAFEANAMDYLLKPFDEERLEDALTRAKKQLSLEKSSRFQSQLNKLMKTMEAEDSSYLDNIIIKDRGREINILAEDISYLEAEGNYVKLHTEDKSPLYRTSMNQVERELNPLQFIRIHRSFIANSNYIDRCKYLGNNEYEVALTTGVKIISGRTYKSNIDDYLNRGN